MSLRTIRSTLRSVRHELRVGQQELAGKAGISRQALSELEAGRSCPSTAVALRLASALRCRVEDLFCLDEDTKKIQARWATLANGKTLAKPRKDRHHGSERMPDGRRTPPSRVALGLVGGQWVAHSLSAEHPASTCIPADGLAQFLTRLRRTDGRHPGVVQV